MRQVKEPSLLNCHKWFKMCCLSRNSQNEWKILAWDKTPQQATILHKTKLSASTVTNIQIIDGISFTNGQQMSIFSRIIRGFLVGVHWRRGGRRTDGNNQQNSRTAPNHRKWWFPYEWKFLKTEKTRMKF